MIKAYTYSVYFAWHLLLPVVDLCTYISYSCGYCSGHQSSQITNLIHIKNKGVRGNFLKENSLPSSQFLPSYYHSFNVLVHFFTKRFGVAANRFLLQIKEKPAITVNSNIKIQEQQIAISNSNKIIFKKVI
jgi:hypothetical protein